MLDFALIANMKKWLLFPWILFLWACDYDDDDTRVCFIGDSITYQWDLEYFFPQYMPLKHAKNGAKIQDLDDWDLRECRGIPSVILMGTNNSSEFFDEERRNVFLQKFYTRIEKIQADPLIVISILPRNFQRQQSSRVNEVIRNVNNRVEKGLDSLNGRFEYLDVYPLFAQDEYEARMDLFKDGLHPNIAGQEILASEVLKVLR